MHSPALGLGWELWARRRWALLAIVAGALALAVLVQVVSVDAAQGVAQVATPLAFFVYLYLLSVFVYSESTLDGRALGFPPRLFTLPVRTSALVAWPMLYGMAAAALLWLWLSGLILIPAGRARSVLWWPALLLAAGVVCFQAVCWTFVRAPFLRLVVAILGLPSVGIGVWLFCTEYNLQLTLTQMTLGLCAIIPAAYALAVAGVARDRRGDRLSWAGPGRLLLWAVPRRPGRERPFKSALAAQRWMEVHRHGWQLPAFVGFFLALLFWATALPLGPADVARFTVAIVSVPIVLAFFVGFGMGKTSFWATDLQLSLFVATRPLSCATLGNAKLHAVWLSALATWGLVLLLAPLWAVLSGNVEVVRTLCDSLFDDQPAWKAGLLASVTLAGLVGLTWLQLVAGMCLSLTGRVAVVNAVALLYVAVGATLVGLGIWTGGHADFFDTLLVVLGWLGGGLILLKLAAAAWTWKGLKPAALSASVKEGRMRRLSLWLAIAACLLVPLYVFVPENRVPTHLVALFVVLALPFTRLTALPAAVAWNRHR